MQTLLHNEIEKNQSNDTPPNCMRCIYHHLTYDQRTPYMCVKLGFKSKIIPSREVKINSGMECQFFKQK